MRFSLRQSPALFAAALLTACVSTVSDDPSVSSSSSQAPLTITPSSSSSVAEELSSSAAAFDPAVLGAYSDSCTTKVAAAVSTVEYKDAERGMTIKLPFNETWGSAPYVWMENVLHFGPPVKFDDGTGCKSESAFSLRFLPKRGAEEAQQEIIAGYESHAMPTPDQGWGVNLVLVDRRAAVQWGIGDWVCPMPVLEIPGTKANVQLNVACHYPKTPLEAQDELEEIMRGISFEGDVQ